MAHEKTCTLPDLNLEDCSHEELLFNELARKLATDSRILQKHVQSKLGAHAFKSILQQLDNTIVSLLDAKCFDDTTSIPVPCSIAGKIPIVASSLEKQQQDVNLLGHSIHWAACSNELMRKGKSESEYKFEKEVHSKAACARHTFKPAPVRGTGCTLFLDTLVAKPGAIPPAPPLRDTLIDPILDDPWSATDPWKGKLCSNASEHSVKNSKSFRCGAWDDWLPSMYGNTSSKPVCLAVNSCSTNSAAEIIDEAVVFSADVAIDEFEKVLDFLAPTPEQVAAPPTEPVNHASAQTSLPLGMPLDTRAPLHEDSEFDPTGTTAAFVGESERDFAFQARIMEINKQSAIDLKASLDAAEAMMDDSV